MSLIWGYPPVNYPPETVLDFLPTLTKADKALSEHKTGNCNNDDNNNSCDNGNTNTTTIIVRTVILI